MHQLWFTAFLNSFLARPVSALLNVLHVQSVDPAQPINDPIAMQILVVSALIVFFGIVRMRLSAEEPGGLQHVMEMAHEYVDHQSHEIIGHGSKAFVPYLVTLGLFILICNLIGVIPGFASPTQFASVPLGCALMTFVYYHAHGVKKQGIIRYIKHFSGPMPWLAWLIFPIEIISHTARIMSLTIRLYANMFAGEMVTLAFFSLVPLLFPIVFLGLHIFVSLLQAFIFMLLAMIYLGGAVGEEEH